MNTNSKHYELLAIEPWDIMEANFPPEQFVAYLKGNIIKYTLRDKGQALTDAQKIKHYAEKLIEVLEKKDMDDFLDEDAEHIYGDYGYGQEDTPEPVEEKSTPALIPNLWYDASLYTVEKLKELLPVGTKVVVTSEHDNDRKVDFKDEKLERAEVTNITKRINSQDTRIATDYDCWYRRYFKIAEE